ncbi:MAG TPA: UDP-3-O-(3-hydroxymyristoyl)glucosamine N-acyltransferase [Phycisphaerae bacterium]|nr:UDP-3-O-(3-hydroxymyristoyl)glucosamine N-acyltransferase [Phycisphaerae bacterium]HUU21563.1 UDP-3-O-(3-hydroxymyristoyl)glucosamine N-acyltransferase [Phycisphaerae bacterium]
MSLGELAERIGGVLTGPADRVVRSAASLSEAGPEDVAFLAHTRYERYMAESAAAAVIVSEGYDGPGERLIRCKDPYFAFREAMVALHGFRRHPFSGIDEQARIDPSAEVGEGVAIAQFASVAAGARIGDGTVLYPGVYVGAGARVGAGCVLHPNVVVYDGCVLGDRVTIHACSVIGEDGFGYATHDGVHHKIPQIGWVEVADDVEIGAACTIDRATLGATRIGPGTKFSNLVAIGHGTKVGRGCLFVAQVGIAGSTAIGDHCSFAGQAGVVGHITIGDRVRVGAKSGVVNDIEDDQEVFGQPAMQRNQAQRVYSIIRQLPDIRQQVKKLGAIVAALGRRREEEGDDEDSA